MIREFRVCKVTLDSFAECWDEEEKLYKMRINFTYVDSGENGNVFFCLKTRKDVEDMTKQLTFIQDKLSRSKIPAILITTLPTESEQLVIFGAGIYWFYYNQKISRYILVDAPMELVISRYITGLI